MKGILLDIGHSDNKDQSYIDLYVRGSDTKIYHVPFDPYFYYQGPEPSNELIKKIEKKGELWKVFVRTPSDVPKCRDELAKHGKIYEYDIPYTQRFLIDHDITPLTVYDWNEKNPETPKKIEENYKPTAISFDIETYNPRGMPEPEKDAIVMLSTHDGKQGKVYTWKNIALPFVESFKDEKEAIQAFTKSIEHDFVYTYNGDNFDLPYVKKRVEELGISEHIGVNNEPISLRTGMRGLTARIPGRVHLDVYRGMNFLAIIGALKLPRYTLEDVYKELRGKEKLDIDTKNLWKIWDNGSKAQLEELATYAMQDAEAAYELGNELLGLYIALSKLTNQMPFDVSRMSSSQMVEALLMKLAFKRGEHFPNKPGENEFKLRINKQVQGAFVKEPEPGLHENLAVLDFKGLYPSIIISHNIDPSTLNCNCCTKPFESPTGQKFCKKKKGLIPEMLKYVTEKRAAVKARMKKLEPESVEWKRLNAEQQALKIVANSTYGYMNFARARWYSHDCAEATTAWGRKYIKDAAAEAEKRGFKVIYGDSVTAERFVTILDPDGMVSIKNIAELFDENKNNAVRIGDKEVAKLNRYRALTINPKTKNPCWKPIKEIIRHNTRKKVFRVNQKYGETRVTEDHSIIVENEGYKCAKPEELGKQHIARVTRIPKVKQLNSIDLYELLKNHPHKNTCETIKADENHVWFLTDNKKKTVLKRRVYINSKEFDSLLRLLAAYISKGRSGSKTLCAKWTASIYSTHVPILKQLQRDHNTLFTNAEARITPPIPNKTTMHKLQMMNQLAVIMFQQLAGQNINKKMPSFVFHLPREKQELFLEWLLKENNLNAFESRRPTKNARKNFYYTTKSLKLVGGLTLLLRQLGIDFSINYTPSKKTYTISTPEKTNTRFETKINEENYDSYVYDLSVDDSQMFVDSCGQILLHNTDSVFLLRGEKSKDDVLKFLKDYNNSLPEPMELELEGFYPRGIFVTKREGGAAKKRYALIREDGQIEIKGLEFVRRDWSKLAKRTQQEVIRKILEGDVNGAKALVKKRIEQIRKNELPIDDYIIWTQLKRNIKKYEAVGPHVKAAKRLKEAGEDVGEGSVIGYIVTSGAGNIGDRAWPHQHIGKRKPDIEYYINHQLLPAVMKILAELNIKKEELTVGGKQAELGAWT